MKKIMIIIIAVFTTVLFSACTKDTIWVYYDETHCFDKWGYPDVPDKEKLKAVKKYLKSKNISVLKIETTFDETLVQGCFACHCTSGTIIKCKIYEDDLQKIMNENFYK
jgi:hypothetical protein